MRPAKSPKFAKQLHVVIGHLSPQVAMGDIASLRAGAASVPWAVCHAGRTRVGKKNTLPTSPLYFGEHAH